MACAGVGTPGDLALAWMNGGDETVSLNFEAQVPQGAAFLFEEYLLTPGDRQGLMSRSVSLNGNGPLKVGSKLIGKRVAAMSLLKESYGFFLIRGARAAACMPQQR